MSCSRRSSTAFGCGLYEQDENAIGLDEWPCLERHYSQVSQLRTDHGGTRPSRRLVVSALGVHILA